MKEEEKKLLKTFETKLRLLIDRHEDLKSENAGLKEQIIEQKMKNETLQAKLTSLENDYTNLKTATTISLNGSDVRQTKLRLSKLVREVDKCIALLND